MAVGHVITQFCKFDILLAHTIMESPSWTQELNSQILQSAPFYAQEYLL